MIRRSLKRAAACAAKGMEPLRSIHPRVIGLCYHSVHPTESFATVSPELFERHLAWLTDFCDVIPFRAMLDVARERNTLRPAVSLTFDDGYADNYEFAFPLLAKYGLPATIFLTAGLVEGDPEVKARFRELRATPVRPLEWAHARELLAAGLEIGAHTYSHPNLRRLSRNEVATELQVSKEIIEERLETPIDLLAYPFGKPGRHFDQVTTESAEATGYSYAAAVLFRSVRPRDSPLALPRFFMARNTVQDLAAKIRGHWDYLGFWQEHAPIFLARIVSPQDFRW